MSEDLFQDLFRYIRGAREVFLKEENKEVGQVFLGQYGNPLSGSYIHRALKSFAGKTFVLPDEVVETFCSTMVRKVCVTNTRDHTEAEKTNIASLMVHSSVTAERSYSLQNRIQQSSSGHDAVRALFGSPKKGAKSDEEGSINTVPPSPVLGKVSVVRRAAWTKEDEEVIKKKARRIICGVVESTKLNILKTIRTSSTLTNIAGREGELRLYEKIKALKRKSGWMVTIGTSGDGWYHGASHYPMVSVCPIDGPMVKLVVWSPCGISHILQDFATGPAGWSPSMVSIGHVWSLGSRVSARLKAKIWAEEYVDFGALLSIPPQSEKYSLSLARPSGSSLCTPQLTLEPCHQPKKVTTIDQWITAFHTYVSIYSEKFSSQTSRLMKYCETVRDLAQKPGDWYYHDEQFRYLRQSAPDRYPWDQIHWELWLGAVTNFRKSTPQHAQGNDKASQRGRFRTTNQFPKGTCWAFQGGRFCKGCQFEHTCYKCSGKHPGSTCLTPEKRDQPKPRPSAQPPNTAQAGHTGRQVQRANARRGQVRDANSREPSAGELVSNLDALLRSALSEGSRVQARGAAGTPTSRLDTTRASGRYDWSLLEQQCQDFLQNGLAMSTRRTYASAQRRFMEFCRQLGKSSIRKSNIKVGKKKNEQKVVRNKKNTDTTAPKSHPQPTKRGKPALKEKIPAKQSGNSKADIMAAHNQRNALREFELAFTSNGYNHAPRGLRALIVNFTLKTVETIEQGRRRLYRRIFGILWFGNHVGRSHFVPQTPTGSPTYVFPAFLKEAIRTHISGSLKAFQDPEGPGGNFETIIHMFAGACQQFSVVWDQYFSVSDVDGVRRVDPFAFTGCSREGKGYSLRIQGMQMELYEHT
ncbi:hypothetical protein QZH41_005457 [Actinostola sp. cb2023]|nr:hypothetical protein QZH41_005457 [Actinostola sp. cb2023]